MLLDLYADRRSPYPDQPLAEVPVGWREAAGAAWEAQKLRGWWGLTEMAPHSAYEAAGEAFRRLGIPTPQNPYSVMQRDDSPSGRVAGALGLQTREPLVAAWREAARQARERHPEFAAEFPDPFEIEQGALARARRAQEEAAHAERAAEGFTAEAAAFASRMAAAVLTDPVQLATLPLGAVPRAGAGFVAALLRTALTEAAIGGVAQGITTTLSRPAQEAAGITPDPWTDILYAAGGAAVLGGGLRALVEGFRVVRGADHSVAATMAHAADMHELGNPGGAATAMEHGLAMERALADTAAGRRTDAEVPMPARATEPSPTVYAGQPPPPSEGARVFTPSGRAVDVSYRVMELDDLIPSHTPDGRRNAAYPHGEGLQPRDRASPAYVADVRGIARGLNPERLGVSSEAGTGAPVIGPDLVVESGNGRVMALLLARAEVPDRWQAYQSWLASQGHDLSRFRSPVLVAARETALTASERAAFGLEANAPPVSRLGVAEQAMGDARRLDAIIDLHRGGEVTKAENLDFARAFVAQVPASERRVLAATDGTLSTEGARRMRAAILARAYGDGSGLLERLLENPDSNIKAIAGALDDVAPAWARMRALSDRGVLAPGSDRTAELIQAVRTVVEARAKGIAVDDWVANGGFFEDGLSDTAMGFLAVFFREPQFRGNAGRAAIAARLDGYAQAAIATQQRDIFVATPPVRGEAPRAETLAPNVKAARAADEAAAARPPEADVDRSLFLDAQRIAAASDRLVPVEDAAGNTRMVGARQLLDEAEDAERLAAEAAACLLGMATGAAT